jgi:Mg2+ and Co2+ transporter CorA
LTARVAGAKLPLSFVTGLLGVNVGGIPGADNPYGFWSIAALLLLLAAAGLWAFFRWRHGHPGAGFGRTEAGSGTSQCRVI